MLTCYVGDSHGDFASFTEICKAALKRNPDIAEFVSVGDFGFWPRQNMFLRERLQRPVLFIDGNHEDFDTLWTLTKGTSTTYLGEHGYEATYIPRGFRRGSIAYCGGAHSVDRQWRTDGVDWFPEENIRDEDVARTVAGGHAHVLITHETCDEGFSLVVTNPYKKGPDPNRTRIAYIRKQLRPKLHVHGHHHRYGRYRIDGTLCVCLDRCDRRNRGDVDSWVADCTLVADQWGNLV